MYGRKMLLMNTFWTKKILQKKDILHTKENFNASVQIKKFKEFKLTNNHTN